MVSNRRVLFLYKLEINRIERIYRFKRGTEAHFRIAGRRSTFWREISDSPTPISAEYEYDARRCLPILRQNEFPTFTIREQTYTFPCVSICTANIAILFEIYNSASRRELRPQNKREARRRNEIRPRHDLPAANPRTGRQRFYASALSDRIQSGRCRKQKFSVHLSDKKMLSMSIPLAERLRPRTLDEYIGQAHLVGQNGVFRKFLETGNVPSFILWGPPGVGKTTLAKIVATTLKRPFYTLSAVTSGVKEVREVLESARKQKFFDSKPPILFIDEIHRFNKSQQDSLLGAVEQGVVTLIGATTENPSFEVISPLLSRCQVYILQPMTDGELQTLLDRALATDPELKTREIEVQETEALFRFSGGDARKLLNILDIITGAADGKVTITNQYVTDCLQQNIALYDKNGEQHYDVISAFIKRSDLLPGPHAGRRRRAALHRPPAGDPGLGRHRPGQSQRPAAGQRLFRHGAQDRHARSPHHAGRNHDLPGHLAQEQLGLHGHQPGALLRRTRYDQPARTPAPAQRPDQADGSGGVRQRL